MNTACYSRPARWLHWGHALLIVALLGLGWYMTGLPKGSPERSAAYGLHKSLGLCALLWVVVRAGWRWRHPAPPLLLSWAVQQGSRLAHLMLYVLMLAAPLSGFLSSSYTQYPLRLFAWELPRWTAPDKTWNTFYNALHQDFVWSLAVLVGLHILAALWHRTRHDGVWQRMV